MLTFDYLKGYSMSYKIILLASLLLSFDIDLALISRTPV